MALFITHPKGSPHLSARPKQNTNWRLVLTPVKGILFHWLPQSLDQTQKGSEVSIQYQFFRPQDLISRAVQKITPQNQCSGRQQIYFKVNQNASFYPQCRGLFLISVDLCGFLLNNIFLTEKMKIQVTPFTGALFPNSDTKLGEKTLLTILLC